MITFLLSKSNPVKASILQTSMYTACNSSVMGLACLHDINEKWCLQLGAAVRDLTRVVRFMMDSSRPSGSVMVSCGKSMSTSAISLPRSPQPT